MTPKTLQLILSGAHTKNVMINSLCNFAVLLYWTGQLSLASYPYYYHHPNLVQPNYAFEPFGFTRSVVNPYYQVPSPPQLNTNQVYQIIYLQPEQEFNAMPPEYNYFEERNEQQTETPLVDNSTEEEEMNYIIDARRENLTPTQIKSVANLNEEYRGFTYRTQYQGGGHSNVVFYTGKGSHKLMFPSSQREDKSLGDVTSSARTVASDSLDVNSGQENEVINVTSSSPASGHEEAPELTSKNAQAPELTSKNALSSTEKISPTTLDPTTTSPEDFLVEEITASTPSDEQETKSTPINLTTESQSSTENDLLNETSTASSIK